MKKLLWAAMGVALISMVFAGCKKEDPTYSVQVTAAEGGTVEGQNGEYKEGETVIFTAIPADGYYFGKWSDGKTNNPRTINVGTKDITLTAEFATITTVDLGLTSGTLWATCNVGAVNTWDYGNYYAWGETQTKSSYEWDNLKYCTYNSGLTFSKYKYSDTLTILEPIDDAATTWIGADYSTPTEDDWNELKNYCEWEWTTNYEGHNTAGYIIYKAKSHDTHIFLPAAGWQGTYFYNEGEYGCYWSSLRGDSQNNGYYCTFDCRNVSVSEMRRCDGYSVRPVRHKK